MIILLGTRLIIAGWLITLLFIGFRLIRSLVLRLVTLGALLAIVAIAIATLPLLKGQWNELKDFSSGNTIQLDEDASLGRGWGGKAIRFALWQCSKDVIGRHWLTGVGTGDVQDSLQMAYEQRKFYFASRYNKYNAHNQYIQIFVGHGIVGFLLLVLSIGIPLFSKKPKEYSLLYTYFLLLFAGICCTEVILDTNKGIVWYSLINSIFAFTQPENRT
jgi:O-antigen ligase